MIAANGDPLRAQEIEENLSAKWWKRWIVYKEEVHRHGNK